MAAAAIQLVVACISLPPSLPPSQVRSRSRSSSDGSSLGDHVEGDDDDGRDEDNDDVVPSPVALRGRPRAPLSLSPSASSRPGRGDEEQRLLMVYDDADDLPSLRLSSSPCIRGRGSSLFSTSLSSSGRGGQASFSSFGEDSMSGGHRWSSSFSAEAGDFYSTEVGR